MTQHLAGKAFTQSQFKSAKSQKLKNELPIGKRSGYSWETNCISETKKESGRNLQDRLQMQCPRSEQNVKIYKIFEGTNPMDILYHLVIRHTRGTNNQHTLDTCTSQRSSLAASPKAAMLWEAGGAKPITQTVLSMGITCHCCKGRLICMHKHCISLQPVTKAKLDFL